MLNDARQTTLFIYGAEGNSWKTHLLRNYITTLKISNAFYCVYKDADAFVDDYVKEIQS